MAVELFNISVFDLTSGTIRLQLQNLELQTRGVRAADALHAATAVAFDADLIVSTDKGLLLDGLLGNPRGSKILWLRPRSDLSARQHEVMFQTIIARTKAPVLTVSAQTLTKVMFTEEGGNE